MKRIFLAAALFAAAALPLSAQFQFEAVLNGANEVPAVVTQGTGIASITLNRPSNTISYLVGFTGLTGAPTAAHIHSAAVGVNGPVVFPLVQTGPGTFEGQTAALTAAQQLSLFTEGFYCNIHTAANPGGEIRGQIVPAQKAYFKATLNGAQETPPTGSPFAGTAWVRLNEPEGTIYYDVKSTVPVSTAAHVHGGAVGVAGPVLFALNGTSTHFCGTASLTAAQITTLKAGGLYFNIHTAANPGGEIRGQIVPELTSFSATLDGGQENPPTTTTGSGCAYLEFNPATNVLTYSVSYAGLSGAPSAAHIHTGVVGQNGGVTIGFVAGPSPITGTATLTAAQAITLNKGNFYVNIHTAANPSGEIRGQVRQEGYAFGYGGVGISGRPRAVTTGYGHTIGTNAVLSLVNGAPNQGALLFIATGTATSAAFGAPLPLSFGAIGNLWIDASLNFFIPTATDLTGCAEVPVAVPAIPALACFKGYSQWAVNDPSNPSGIVLSDANELTILP